MESVGEWHNASQIVKNTNWRQKQTVCGRIKAEEQLLKARYILVSDCLSVQISAQDSQYLLMNYNVRLWTWQETSESSVIAADVHSRRLRALLWLAGWVGIALTWLLHAESHNLILQGLILSCFWLHFSNPLLGFCMKIRGNPPAFQEIVLALYLSEIFWWYFQLYCDLHVYLFQVCDFHHTGFKFSSV